MNKPTFQDVKKPPAENAGFQDVKKARSPDTGKRVIFVNVPREAKVSYVWALNKVRPGIGLEEFGKAALDEALRGLVRELIARGRQPRADVVAYLESLKQK